jgi:hypothetical protein
MVYFGQPISPLIALGLVQQKSIIRVALGRIALGQIAQAQLSLMPYTAHKSLLECGLTQARWQPSVRMCCVFWN